MKVHRIITAAILVATLSLTANDKPNIVFVFADDLGYGDLSCYGAKKINTPNIDKLAAEGRKFTDAHSASAVCSPSRYGKMTGRFPHRKNFWGPTVNSSALTIDPRRETISSLLKKADYQTAFFGKWHLGFGEKAPEWNKDLKPGPLELGFDYFYGIPCANSVAPFVYVENHRVIGLDPKDPIKIGGKVHTKVMEDKGAGRIGGAKAAHDLYVDDQIGVNLTQRSVKWLENVDKEKPFFLLLSTTNIHHPFTPDKQFVGTSEAGHYGDFTHELDWMTGQLMDTLEKHGLAENTIFIFTSDNGGMLNLEGQRTVENGHPINGDLLGAKFGAWEGGHRIPMIIRWPDKVPAGSTSDELISHVDFLATFSVITGQELKNPEDSLNQLTTITGTPETPVRDSIVICPNSPFHLSIRKGKWVYIPLRGEGGFQSQVIGNHLLGGPAAVTFMGKTNSDVVDGKLRKDAPKAQLYNLDTDPSQTKNVYNDHPEVVKELSALLDIEQDSVPKTKPIGWINIKGAKKKKK